MSVHTDILLAVYRHLGNSVSLHIYYCFQINVLISTLMR